MILYLLALESGLGLEWYWFLIGCNMVWGVLWEFTSGVYGVFADKKKFD
jgi:hypothetical protein